LPDVQPRFADHRFVALICALVAFLPLLGWMNC